MKRLLRTLLAAIGVLALVAVGVVVYVTTFFDPDDLKPRLVEVVREQSGLELTLDGPLAWSFYPRLGVSVENAEAWLPDQEVEDDRHFAAFEHAEVSLSFAPLLRGEIAIDGLTLDGLRLNLERDQEGRGNWEVLLERLAEGSESAEEVLAPASAGPDPSDAAGGLAVALNIASVQLREGEVRYRDLRSGEVLRLHNLEVGGSNVNPTRPFPIEASFDLARYDDLEWQEMETPPLLESEVALQGRVGLALADRRYELEDLDLETTTRLADSEDQQQVGMEGSRLLVDAEAGRLEFEDGRLETTLRHAGLGEEALALSLAFRLEADLAEDRARLQDLELSGDDDLRLSGGLEVTELSGAPRYSGQLSLSPLSLRPWLERFGAPPDTTDEEALDEVALTSPVRGDLETLEFPGLTLVLDDSTFTGRLAAGLDGRRLELDLEGDRLDLDAYLPPAEPTEDTSLVSPPGIERAHAQDPGELVPEEWLAALALEADLRLDELRLMGLDYTDVGLTLSGAEGRQRLTGFEADFYEGEIAATGELDLREAPPRWNLTPRLSRVSLAPMLEALDEEPAPLRGRLNVQGELATRGNTWPDLKRHLGGNLEAGIDEGAILDVNVSRELCTAVATLEGEETSRDWHEDTRFERAEAGFTLDEGDVQTDDLLVTLPGIELGGEGRLDLVSEQFYLRAAARFVDTADAACEVNPRLERVPFPVRCEGSLDGDKGEWCGFDRDALQDTLAELLRNEVSERAGEAVSDRLEGALEGLDERLGEDAEGELREALRGLFN